MAALNCLQAQTLGRSWQSNRGKAQRHRPRRRRAVRRDPLGRAIETCVRSINLYLFVALEIQYPRSGELISHLVSEERHKVVLL